MITNIKIKELISIMEVRLSTTLFESFLNILHPDYNDKLQICKKFEIILKNALIKHTIHFANKVTSIISISKSGIYRFVDNFNLYLQDSTNFNELDIILVPNYIINMNYNLLSSRMPISKKLYVYNKPVLISNVRANNIYVTYGANYPLIIDYAPDGFFTEGSALYYLNSNSQQFLTRLEYELLIYIKSLNDQVKIPELGVSILSNLDDQIKRVEKDLETWIDTSSSIMDFWGS